MMRLSLVLVLALCVSVAVSVSLNRPQHNSAKGKSHATPKTHHQAVPHNKVHGAKKTSQKHSEPFAAKVHKELEAHHTSAPAAAAKHPKAHKPATHAKPAHAKPATAHGAKVANKAKAPSHTAKKHTATTKAVPHKAGKHATHDLEEMPQPETRLTSIKNEISQVTKDMELLASSVETIQAELSGISTDLNAAAPVAAAAAAAGVAGPAMESKEKDGVETVVAKTDEKEAAKVEENVEAKTEAKEEVKEMLDDKDEKEDFVEEQKLQDLEMAIDEDDKDDDDEDEFAFLEEDADEIVSSERMARVMQRMQPRAHRRTLLSQLKADDKTTTFGVTGDGSGATFDINADGSTTPQKLPKFAADEVKPNDIAYRDETRSDEGVAAIDPAATANIGGLDAMPGTAGKQMTIRSEGSGQNDKDVVCVCKRHRAPRGHDRIRCKKHPSPSPSPTPAPPDQIIQCARGVWPSGDEAGHNDTICIYFPASAPPKVDDEPKEPEYPPECYDERNEFVTPETAASRDNLLEDTELIQHSLTPCLCDEPNAMPRSDIAQD